MNRVRVGSHIRVILSLQMSQLRWASTAPVRLRGFGSRLLTLMGNRDPSFGALRCIGRT